MVDIWICYRAIVGSSILLLLALGGVFIGIGVQLSSQISAALEQSEHDDWNEEIRSTRTNSATTVTGEEAAPNQTRTLKWPPIPFKTDAFAESDEPSPWPDDSWFIFITMGVLAVTLSLLGVYTVYNSSSSVLIIMFTSLTTIFVLAEFFFVNIHICPGSLHLNDEIERLRVRLRRDYRVGADADSRFTLSFNSAMLAWNCCGVVGPADFLGLEYTYTWSYLHDERETTLSEDSAEDRGAEGAVGRGGSNNVTFKKQVKFPLACCKREIRKKGFEALLECAASGDTKLINNKGCYPMVFEYFLRVHGDKTVDMFMYIIAFEVLQIIMVTTLVHIPKKFEKEAAKLAVEYAQTIERQAQTSMEQATEENQSLLEEMREIDWKPSEHSPAEKICTPLNRRYVFVPFAKVPSVTSNSTACGERRLSTEIW